VALEAPETRFSRITHLLDRVTLHPASLESYASIFHVFSKHDFDECYHLAAQSFVAESFADGFSTMSTNINGTHYVLAALRESASEVSFLLRRLERDVWERQRSATERDDLRFSRAVLMESVKSPVTI
jgi:GDPmannose 4,6-dehydratase